MNTINFDTVLPIVFLSTVAIVLACAGRVLRTADTGATRLLAAGARVGPAVLLLVPATRGWAMVPIVGAWVGAEKMPSPKSLTRYAPMARTAAIGAAMAIALEVLALVPAARYHAAGALAGALAAAVAVAARSRAREAAHWVLAGGSALGGFAANQAWHIGLLGSAWDLPLACALAGAGLGCLVSPSARAALRELPRLGGAAERAERIVTASRSAGLWALTAAAIAAVQATPDPVVRWVAAGWLFALGAELARHRIATAEETRSLRTLENASSILNGICLGWVSLIPIVSETFGLVVVNDDKAGDWLAVWGAGGLCAGLMLTYVGEQATLSRGATTAAALGLAAIGSLLAGAAPTMRTVEAATFLAGIGIGAISALMPAEVGQRLRTAGLAPAVTPDRLFVVSVAATLVVGGAAGQWRNPGIAMLFIVALTAGGAWALSPALLTSGRPEPDRTLRELLKDKKLRSLILITCGNYCCMVPLDMKAAAMLDAQWTPLWVGVALGATVLPAVFFTGWWDGKMVREGVRSTRFASWLGIGALVAFALGLLTGQPATGLVIGLAAVEASTTFVYLAVRRAAVADGAEVGPVSLMNLSRLGITRAALAYGAVYVFDLTWPLPGEWLLVVLAALPAMGGLWVAYRVTQKAPALVVA